MNKHKHLLHLIAFFLLFQTGIEAQLPANCNAAAPRVIIAGDSWAQYMADDGWYQTLLESYGHGDKTAISETYETLIACPGSGIDPGDYAVSGSEAREWADEANYPYLQNLINAINANPSLDMVVLSIGGNDVLRGRGIDPGDIPGWYKNMDMDIAGSEAALFATIQADTWYIINEVRSRARDIDFMISSYDFPNFNVESFCAQFACPKREELSRDDNGNGSIDADELITDAELNDMMVRVETIRQGMATSPTANPRVFYDNGMGLMHYYYGYDDGLYPFFSNGSVNGSNNPPIGVDGVAPFSIGGIVSTPSDRENFRSVGVLCLPGIFGADPIHLDAEGYEIKIKNQMDNILFEHYRGEPDATFYSEGANDGYVDILGDESPTSNGIRMGDKGSFFPFTNPTSDYRGILSFNTANLPDNAIVTGASIYMIRSGAADNPFIDKTPSVDIKNGNFGASAAIEFSDGTDAADATDIGCFHGSVDANHDAVRIDIDAAALSYINLTGRTQFRLSLDDPDYRDEYTNFYDGGGAAPLVAGALTEKEPQEIYKYRTVEIKINEDGTISERVLKKGPRMIKKNGYENQEKLKSMEQIGEDRYVQEFVAVTAIEHLGLQKHMLDFHNAPAQGRAPFLDVTYDLNIVLPIDLNYFRAVAKGKESLLTWQTSSEQNSDRFEIERSMDGRNWNYIGQVLGSGNSDQLIDYQFIDPLPEMGINYYRLRMIDLDRSEAFSSIQTVEFKQAVNVYAAPNPFKDRIDLYFDLPVAQNISVQITDMLGQTVYQTNSQIQAGSMVRSFTGLDHLSGGTYIVSIITKDGIKNIKIIKK